MVAADLRGKAMEAPNRRRSSFEEVEGVMGSGGCGDGRDLEYSSDDILLFNPSIPTRNDTGGLPEFFTVPMVPLMLAAPRICHDL